MYDPVEIYSKSHILANDLLTAYSKIKKHGRSTSSDSSPFFSYPAFFFSTLKLTTSLLRHTKPRVNFSLSDFENYKQVSYSGYLL